MSQSYRTKIYNDVTNLLFERYKNAKVSTIVDTLSSISQALVRGLPEPKDNIRLKNQSKQYRAV